MLCTGEDRDPMHTVFDFRRQARRAGAGHRRVRGGRHRAAAHLRPLQRRAAARRGAGAAGVAQGERVAILCHNCATFFEVLFACGKAAAILVPLNWRQTPAELTPILADCGACLLLHDAATAGLAAALGTAGGPS
jgi:fatty-acyl-CoA synthase